jgi:hypothetical protein
LDRVEELEEETLRRLEFSVAERTGHGSSRTKLERRLRDRAADTAAALQIWKLVGLAFFVSATIYFLLAFPRWT